MTPSLEGLPSKSPPLMRLTSPRQTSTWYFIVSGRACRYCTLLKGDLEVVVAKGYLIVPSRNFTARCSLTSYPGHYYYYHCYNASRKFEKYHYLLHDLKSKYPLVKFVNLFISSLGIFGQSCNSFIEMCTDVSINTGHTNYIITKSTNIIIRTTYYIFCKRNKP